MASLTEIDRSHDGGVVFTPPYVCPPCRMWQDCDRDGREVYRQDHLFIAAYAVARAPIRQDMHNPRTQLSLQRLRRMARGLQSVVITRTLPP